MAQRAKVNMESFRREAVPASKEPAKAADRNGVRKGASRVGPATLFRMPTRPEFAGAAGSAYSDRRRRYDSSPGNER